MRSKRIYQYCSYEIGPRSYRVYGTWLSFSDPVGVYSVRDSAGRQIIVASSDVPSPGPQMKEVEEALTFDHDGRHLEIEIEIDVPEDAEYESGTLTFELVGPPLGPEPRYIDGIPAECVVPDEPEQITIENFACDDSGDALFSALVIEELYRDFNAAKTRVRNIVDPEDYVEGVPASGIFGSGILVCRVGEKMVVWIVGTQRNQDLITQGIQMMRGPIDYLASYGTIPMWANASENLLAALIPAGSGLKKIVLCGHSGGGATCALVACVLRDTRPDLEIQLQTFGSPRFGDFRVERILNTMRVCQFVNIGDPVPYTPPTRDDLSRSAFMLVGPFVAQQMARFKTANGRQYLFADGTLLDGGTYPPQQDVISAFVRSWWFQVPGPTVAQHQMTAYVERLSLHEQIPR